MYTISQIFDEKGRDIWSVASTENVIDAIRLMAEKSVGALMVIDAGKLSGVFSERDYARKVILDGKSSRNTPVGDIMTREVISVQLSDSVNRALATMSSNKIRHLPVFDDGNLVGVLSIGDLVKAKIADQEQQIESLEQYITGG